MLLRAAEIRRYEDVLKPQHLRKMSTMLGTSEVSFPDASSTEYQSQGGIFKMGMKIVPKDVIRWLKCLFPNEVNFASSRLTGVTGQMKQRLLQFSRR